MRWNLKAVATLGLAGVAWSLSGSLAHATVLYSNIEYPPSSPTNFSDTIASTGDGPLADSFSTGNDGFILQDVEVALTMSRRATPTGTVTVALFDDAGATPGTAIAILGMISDNDCGDL